MYATCLFCNSALGSNEVLEHFPVGRRLAFDAAKGRLWVVCARCQRWNLSPLETRWEAIEEAERAYRNAKLRASTENIGLARLSEGLELVRIGAPQLPEFAAWRYGDRFAGRHRRALRIQYGILGFALVPFANAVMTNLGMASQMVVPASATVMACLGFSAYHRYLLWQARNTPKTTIRADDGTLLHLTANNVAAATIFPAGKSLHWQLTVPHVETRPATGIPRILGTREVAGYEHRPAMITGSAALLALSKVLPALNGTGGSKRNVADAVNVLSESTDLGTMLRGGSTLNRDSNKFFRLTHEQTYIRAFPAHIRLAMEMSVHEADERRALEGELHELEVRWRDADAIARIADDMFVPERVREAIASRQ